MCLLSCFSCVRLFMTPWGVACQASLSLGLSRQEYWSGLPCPPPGELPNLETEPMSLTVSCIGRWVLYTTRATWEAHYLGYLESKSSENIEPKRQVLCGCAMPFSSLPMLRIQTQVGRAQLWGLTWQQGSGDTSLLGGSPVLQRLDAGPLSF